MSSNATQPVPATVAPTTRTAGLQAVPLTGNRDMAEDLERETCPTCERTFAPSVLVRHAPICARNIRNSHANAVDPGAKQDAPPPPATIATAGQAKSADQQSVIAALRREQVRLERALADAQSTAARAQVRATAEQQQVMQLNNRLLDAESQRARDAARIQSVEVRNTRVFGVAPVCVVCITTRNGCVACGVSAGTGRHSDGGIRSSRDGARREP